MTTLKSKGGTLPGVLAEAGGGACHGRVCVRHVSMSLVFTFRTYTEHEEAPPCSQRLGVSRSSARRGGHTPSRFVTSIVAEPEIEVLCVSHSIITRDHHSWG